MTATPAAVRVRALRTIYRPARYREVAALNGLDLDIGAGEMVALRRPDGAGKTTAVQTLTASRSATQQSAQERGIAGQPGWRDSWLDSRH